MIRHFQFRCLNMGVRKEGEAISGGEGSNELTGNESVNEDKECRERLKWKKRESETKRLTWLVFFFFFLRERLSRCSLPLSGQRHTPPSLSCSLPPSLSRSIHLSPCLPVNFKWRIRTEKQTLEGEWHILLSSSCSGYLYLHLTPPLSLPFLCSLSSFAIHLPFMYLVWKKMLWEDKRCLGGKSVKKSKHFGT